MHLKHSALHLFFVNHGSLLSSPEFPILSRLGLTNAILFLMIINYSVYSEADDLDDDRSRLTRRKWCPWSSWSPCSPTKCISGHVRRTPSLWRSLEEIPMADDIQTNQCVLPSTNISRKPNRAYVQQTIRGQTKVIVAEKQRFRTCDCQSVSILNVFRLVSRHECYPGETEFECNECVSSDKVYFSRDSSSIVDIIPFCSFDHSGFQLYKILGGIVGAIALITLVVCFVRFLFRQICGPRQNDGNATGSGLNRNGRRRNRTSHLQSNAVSDDASEYLQNHRNTTGYPINLGNMDLPPAYTDIVKLSGITPLPANTTATNPTTLVTDRFTTAYDWLPPPALPTQNDNQITHPNGLPKSSPMRMHRFSCSIVDDNEQNNATSSQILSPKQSNTPPPPSYEEIIAATTNSIDAHTQSTAVVDRSVSVEASDEINPSQSIHRSDNAAATTTTTTTTTTNNNTSSSGSGNVMNTDRTETSSAA
ncbi:unnamed protein product [Trichobilharzia szidati]|nr:unnamed protein product [Trichobilharzia szidati]